MPVDVRLENQTVFRMDGVFTPVAYNVLLNNYSVFGSVEFTLPVDVATNVMIKPLAASLLLRDTMSVDNYDLNIIISPGAARTQILNAVPKVSGYNTFIRENLKSVYIDPVIGLNGTNYDWSFENIYITSDSSGKISAVMVHTTASTTLTSVVDPNMVSLWFSIV